MAEQKNFDFMAFLQALFGLFEKGEAIGKQSLSAHSSGQGTDVARFQQDFLTRLVGAFNFGPAANEYVSEKSAGAKEAALQMGYADGIVPADRLDEFFEKEQKVRHEVLDLRSDLMGRSIELYDIGAPKCHFEFTFASDEGTKEILRDAEQKGMSPTLIESVKQSLLEQDRRNLGDDFIREERSR